MDLKLPKPRIMRRNASLLKRLFAFIIDLLVINIVIVSAFQKVFLKFINPEGTTMELVNQLSTGNTGAIFTSLFFIILLSLAYFTFFELKLLQTPGMMLLKIKVEGELTFWKALLRNAFIIPLFPFYILWVIEPIHLLFRKKRLLEEMTNTSTIEEIAY